MDEHASELEKRAYERVLLELTNRSLIMGIHGALLVLVGMTMAITGAPAPIEATFGPWSRIMLGGAAVLTGLTILLGSALTDNLLGGWLAQVTGFATGLFWHLAIAVTYTIAAAEVPMATLDPGQVLASDVTNRGYIPLIYLGYVALTAVNLRTVWKLGPPPR